MRSAKRSVRASARDVKTEWAAPPAWIAPQLCRLVTAVPEGADWAHEVKFDGYRMHARLVDGQAALLTRTGLDWTQKYREIAQAFGALKRRQAYVDGELCALGADGATSFANLQGHGQKPARLIYFAFDLLHLDGEDLTARPLLERKARLEALLQGAPDNLRYSAHVVGEGARVYAEAAKHGLEGVVSKAVGAPYLPGDRGVWVKTKSLNRQEFVIVGWTDPEGSRPALGSLLLGYYGEDGKLAYAGRAGTGMRDAELHALVKKLAPLAQTAMPLAAPPPKNTRGKPLVLSRVHWVRPKLVAEVTYLTWAPGGLLRHVVYQGLREDKAARDVRKVA